MEGLIKFWCSCSLDKSFTQKFHQRIKMWRLFLACPVSREISAHYVKSFLILLFIFHHLITESRALENGRECTKDTSCDHRKFLECGGNTCSCPSRMGMIWDPEMETCMIMAGAPCFPNGVKDAECITNSSCIAGVCECDDYFLQNGFGLCELSYGATCSDKEKCAARYLLECSGSTNSQQQRTCKCRGEEIEYVWDEQRRKCVSTAGGRCEFDDEFGNADDKLECIQNSECVGLGVCQCKAGFKQSPEGKCLLKYGEKCNDTEGLVCNYKYEHLICQAGICGCEFYGQQAFQPEIQTCRWLVGEDCDITQDDGHNQPAGFPRLRRCVNDAFCKPFRPGHHKGTCVCKRGFEISSEKTCTKDRGHGRPCSASMDCDKKRYLECIPDEEQGSHCECLQNEMYFDGKECRVFPGKSCQQNNLCALNSYCEGEWCVCNEGYQIGNSDCFPVTRRHGHSLELPSDNFSHPYPEMSCDETFLGNVERLKCKCQMKVNSHTWSTEKVACLALVGNQCFSDEDCIDYAMCDSDGYTCQCSSAAHTTTNRTCVLKSTVPKDLDTNENAGDWTERLHKLKSIRADEISNETANDGTGIPFSLKMVAFETLIYISLQYFILL